MHYNNARRLVSLGIFFALSLVLVFGSVSSSSSYISPFSLAFPSSLPLNMAFAVDMNDAPATTESATDAPPKNNEGDNDGDKEGTRVTTRTITVEEDNDTTGDNKGYNKKEGDSNGSPKAINLGKCSEPDHEHDPFTNECKPVYTGCGILFPDTRSCTNTPSQIQGDDNSVAVAAAQTGDNTADVSQDETNEQSNVLVTGDNEATTEQSGQTSR